MQGFCVCVDWDKLSEICSANIDYYNFSWGCSFFAFLIQFYFILLAVWSDNEKNEKKNHSWYYFQLISQAGNGRLGQVKCIVGYSIAHSELPCLLHSLANMPCVQCIQIICALITYCILQKWHEWFGIWYLYVNVWSLLGFPKAF